MVMPDSIRPDVVAEIETLTTLQKKIVLSIYEAPNEGLRLWQVQKKVSATKLETQDALRELLSRGYVGILSMGGGPKYHKIAATTRVVAALQASETLE